MKVKEAMVSEVFSCQADTSLEFVALAMWNNDCGCIPVVDQEKKPIGIVTDRDIVMSSALQHKPLWDTRVADIIQSHSVFNCNADDNISDALEMMRQHKIRRLPVVDKQGQLAGIISMGDIIAFAETDKKAPFAYNDTAAMLKAVSAHHRPHSTSSAGLTSPA